MLRSLYIENIAVISRADIRFESGFNVFTGETGAGKTVLLGAIGAVMGQRISHDMIRTGETRAQVTAVFECLSVPLREELENQGFALDEEGTLMLTRILRPDSSECRIGGRPATTAAFKALSPLLIDLHGQHDNTLLLSPDYHLSLIDRFGSLLGQVQAYGETWVRLRDIRTQLQDLRLDEGMKAHRMDLLQYQATEIEDAQLTDGEEEELQAQRELMRHAEQVAQALGEARELLNPEYGEQSGVQDQFSELADAVTTAAAYIPELREASERLVGISYELEELGRDLGGYLETVEFSPRQLNDTEERLERIHQLKKKYGSDIAAVLRFGEAARQELETLETSARREQELSCACEAALAHAQKLADALSTARRETGARFAAAVEEELRYLDMPSVRMVVEQGQQTLGPLGQDTIQLLIAPNPGEPPRPVHKIASGGEISRIMLSVKNVLTDTDAVSSIFDEIDAGVSGRAADKIGRKLAEVGKGRQVLCVTHLAQVAAWADQHLLIRKESVEGRTFTQVIPLEGEERVRELARIMSGDAVTDAALLAAREMLEGCLRTPERPHKTLS